MSHLYQWIHSVEQRDKTKISCEGLQGTGRLWWLSKTIILTWCISHKITIGYWKFQEKRWKKKTSFIIIVRNYLFLPKLGCSTYCSLPSKFLCQYVLSIYLMCTVPLKLHFTVETMCDTKKQWVTCSSEYYKNPFRFVSGRNLFVIHLSKQVDYVGFETLHGGNTI